MPDGQRPSAQPVLNNQCPTGPVESRWTRRRFELKLVNPANKRKY
jgi:succinate dehydrogenase / fumarate reductase flavoprotein subunit